MAQLAPQMGGGKTSTSLSHFPRQLFIHCVASLPGFRQLAGHVPGVDKYGERALLMARRNDLVCLAHQVPEAYLEFLNELELGPDPAHIIRIPDATGEQTAVPMATRLQHVLASGMRWPKQLMDNRELWLNSFAASQLDAPMQSSLAEVLGNPVQLINEHPPQINLYDKHVFRQHADTLGLPLPPGESVMVDRDAATVSSRTLPVRHAIGKYLSFTGRVIVRGALGASGSSVFVVGDDDELQRCVQSIDKQEHTDFYLVEPFFDVEVSPNIGMFIDPRDGTISCVSASDQILDGQVCHLGNRFPSEARLVDQMVATATNCCTWLRDRGTSGFLGFDFCEYLVPGSTQRRFFFAELNPRFNGATYPAHLLAHVNRSGRPRWRAFRASTIQTTLPSFAALEELCRDLFFDGRKTAGIIPYNVGLLEHGKLMLAIFGESRGDVATLENELFLRLSNAQIRDSNRAVA